jgi:hypothetical protein
VLIYTHFHLRLQLWLVQAGISQSLLWPSLRRFFPCAWLCWVCYTVWARKLWIWRSKILRPFLTEYRGFIVSDKLRHANHSHKNVCTYNEKYHWFVSSTLLVLKHVYQATQMSVIVESHNISLHKKLRQKTHVCTYSYTFTWCTCGFFSRAVCLPKITHLC